MDRSILESIAVFLVFIVVFFLADSLNLEKFQQRFDPGQRPVIKSHRLPFRFSMRSLLIATTLTAAIMMLVVFAFR